jgi:serine/threonine protein kinase
VIVTLGGVRIIDFGIARTLDTTTDFTRTGVVMGSLGWTSPEHLDGRSPVPAMDIFGWGCVVAYAATGAHPFGGVDTASRTWRIQHAEPNLDALPTLLADLVKAALDRDTGQRPTAQELLLGLVGAAVPTVRAHPAPPPEPVQSAPAGRRWSVVGRHPKTAALLAGLPVGLVLTVALASAAGSLDRPAGAGTPVTATSTSPATAPASSTGTRAGVSPDEGPVDSSDAGPRLAPGGSIPSPTPPPGVSSTASDDNDDDGGDDPGNGPGNGNGTTRSKKPKP